MPKISIIIPIYDKKRYINKCLDSILEQTYKEFEVILIDDGSTDGSAEICDDYKEKDKRIKVIHIENAGVSNARNIGLDFAKGEYVQFVDSDDYLDVSMLEELVKITEKYNPSIIISGISKVNHNEVLIKEILPKLNGIKNKSEMLQNFAQEQFETGIYGCISNKLIKRDIIEKINLRFNTKIKLAEDFDFYLALYNEVFSIYFCDKSYYFYLQNAENSSINIYKNNDYMVQIKIALKEKYLLISNGSLNENNKKYVERVISNFVICYVYENFNWYFSENRNILKKLYANKEILKSLALNNQDIFKKCIIYLLKCESEYIVYILLLIRKLCEVSYRGVKSLI